MPHPHRRAADHALAIVERPRNAGKIIESLTKPVFFLEPLRILVGRIRDQLERHRSWPQWSGFLIRKPHFGPARADLLPQREAATDDIARLKQRRRSGVGGVRAVIHAFSLRRS